MSCEGRGCSDGSTSQETPRIDGRQQGLQGRHGTDSPLAPSEGAWPYRTRSCTSGLQTERLKCIVYSHPVRGPLFQQRQELIQDPSELFIEDRITAWAPSKETKPEHTHIQTSELLVRSLLIWGVGPYESDVADGRKCVHPPCPGPVTAATWACPLHIRLRGMHNPRPCHRFMP